MEAQGEYKVLGQSWKGFLGVDIEVPQRDQSRYFQYHIQQYLCQLGNH